jgi:hypothetical protein
LTDGGETIQDLRASGCDPETSKRRELLTSAVLRFLNDENRSPSTTIVDALRNYDIVPVLWSGRDSVRQELAA